jgi:hypothetical protein
MQKFHIISCHVLWRELCYFAALSENNFTFHFLKQGLHNTPDVLRSELQQAIDSARGDFSAILIGYGLCSNGLTGIRARDKKLVIMRGHDCITFLLGSKERYQQYFNKNSGTYWYSPGWIDDADMPGEARYNKLLADYVEKFGENNARYLMEIEQDWINKYSNAAFIDSGFIDTENYKKFTRECAAFLGWNYEELTGNPDLIKNFLAGNWNGKDFLIVKPGERVVASYDEGIIRAVKGTE